MILKFTKDGKFVMMIGGHGAKGPDSNNKDGGKNGTPLFYLPADITVDPSTNRMYVSDGYGNRRVVDRRCRDRASTSVISARTATTRSTTRPRPPRASG